MSLQPVVSESPSVVSEEAIIPLSPAIVKLVRFLPDALLAIYLDGIGVNSTELLANNGAGRARVRKIVDGIGMLEASVLGLLGADAERFVDMADAMGQDAMQSVVMDHQGFASQENALTRSVWLFLREPASFRRAEEIRYADNYRMGRMWDGFIGPKGVPVSDQTEHHLEFGDRIKGWFRANQVKVEIFERTRVEMEDGERQVMQLVQLVVYREGLPDSVLEFEQGDLTRRSRRPVMESSLTYEADSGVIEVVAQDRPSREEMARVFAESLLRQGIAGKRVPLREFDLRPLMTPHPFSTDLEDGIAAVEVVSLTLKPLLDGAERVTFDADRKTGRSLYERIFEWFQEHSPLNQGFFMQKAILSVIFQPDGGVGRGRVVPVRLSLPNGCNLKSRTEKERLVCEKYLSHWKLVQEV